MLGPSPHQRLMVALDLDDADRIKRLVDVLGDAVSIYKVGWVPFLAGGIPLVTHLRSLNKRIFLDLKLFDVPNTVHEAVKLITQLGVSFVTVHGNRENIDAAVAARGDSPLKILAVTLLTSLSAQDVRQLYGIASFDVEAHVVKTARRLLDSGCDGVISAPTEVIRLRKEAPGAIIVTPGVRDATDTVDDHKRVGTARGSIRDGADYLVVGRSIYTNPKPRERAAYYVGEIAAGLLERS